MNRKLRLAGGLLNDPRGRSESEWLDTLDNLVACFSSSTSSYLHTGVYWCDDKPGYASCSLVARVRSHDPLPGVYWEAALCYSANDGMAYADAFVFPFLKDSPVTSSGRLEERPPDSELDEYRLWKLIDDQFVDRGWLFPDGPGEWGWITKPGDEYWQDLEASLSATVFADKAPIIVKISDLQVSTSLNTAVPARISLLHVNRGRENTNLVPWNERPPRANSSHVVALAECNKSQSGYQVDLRNFNIRGGWKPGRYHVAVRVQYTPRGDDWSFRSDISKPFKFTISE